MSRNGYSVPHQTELEPASKTNLEANSGAPNSAHVHLNGHVARRIVKGREFFWWDKELRGFGLRSYRSGRKCWFVQLRQRGKQKRITLGRPGDMSAEQARSAARAELAKAALDGLPAASVSARKSPGVIRFKDYAPQFWNDYSRHWKPSTRARNHGVIFGELVTAFGILRVDAIRRADILRWRDRCAERGGAFNRSIPVMSAMMGYAEQLGLRPRGSNPCKGTPRYKRKAAERFLSTREFERLGNSLRAHEEIFPLAVQAIRLIIYTGARRGEIETLRWEWIQPPRLMLPDSKTGPKIIYLNRQALAVINAVSGRRETGLVFPAPRRPGAGINLNPAWAAIRRHAAMPDVRLHDLRHSFASIAIADGISLVVIGKLLGHALAETTERYAHLADEAISDAARRVSGSLARCLGLAA